MVVAWVRVGPTGTPTAWMLVSLKQGKVKSIIREGSDSVSKYAAADVKPMRVTYSSKWIGTTPVACTRGRCYIWYRSIYTWDGDAFRKVVGAGEDAVIGEKTYRLSSLTLVLLGTFDDGRALLTLGVAAPRKTAVVALFDGKALMPLLIDGEPVGALPARMDTSVYDMPLYSIARGGVFAKMRVAGAPCRHALFWVEPGKAELVAAYGKGEHSLLGPQRETWDVKVDSAPSHDLQFLGAADQPFGGYTLLLRSKGEIKTVTLPSDKPGLRYYPGLFMREDPPLYLFQSTRNTTKDTEWTISATKTDQKIFDSFWLVGEDGKLRELPQPEEPWIVGGLRYLYRVMTEPYAGVLLRLPDAAEVEVGQQCRGRHANGPRRALLVPAPRRRGHREGAEAPDRRRRDPARRGHRLRRRGPRLRDRGEQHRGRDALSGAPLLHCHQMTVILQGSLRHFPPWQLLPFLACSVDLATLQVEGSAPARLWLRGGRVVWGESPGERRRFGGGGDAGGGRRDVHGQRLHRRPGRGADRGDGDRRAPRGSGEARAGDRGLRRPREVPRHRRSVAAREHQPDRG